MSLNHHNYFNTNHSNHLSQENIHIPSLTTSILNTKKQDSEHEVNSSEEAKLALLERTA